MARSKAKPKAEPKAKVKAPPAPPPAGEMTPEEFVADLEHRDPDGFLPATVPGGPPLVVDWPALAKKIAEMVAALGPIRLGLP